MKKTFCSLLAATMVFFSFFSNGNLTYAKGDISAPLLATEIDDKVLAELAQLELDYKVVSGANDDVTNIILFNDDFQADVLYEHESGNVYLNGELVSNIEVHEPGKNSVRPNYDGPITIHATGPKIYNLGSPSMGDWEWTGYERTGSFSIFGKTADVLTVAASIVAVLSLSPRAEAPQVAARNATITLAAAALIQAIDFGQHTVYWDFYHHRDKNGQWVWYDSTGFYNPTLRYDNMKVMVNHYYGWPGHPK